MRIPRRPWLFVGLWTALCGVGVWFVASRIRPPHPDCFDMCGMGEAIASYFIGVIVVVWLFVSVIAIVLWYSQEDRKTPDRD